MPQIVMVAQSFVEFDGRTAAAGEIFVCTPIQAAILNFARTARFASPEEAQSINPRDLRAGTKVMTAEDPEPPATPEPAPTPSKKKRTYRRRDLKAER
jgi:hypothetical protein